MSPNLTVDFEDISKAEISKGDSFSDEDDVSMLNSVIENDENAVNDGKLVSDVLNQGFSSFVPDMMFDNLVKNFSMAEHIYGKSMIRLLSGYDSSYIKKNINIPEFQRELKQKIKDKFSDLKKKGLIDKEGSIKNKGLKLASLVLYTEELDHLMPKGLFGEKIHKKASHYGDKEEVKDYKKSDRYKDLAIRKSIKTAIRRNHKELILEDLKTFERQSKGSVEIIYAIDASGSMKGPKIEMAKKAGIALSFKAIQKNDKVGLITFGTEIKEKIAPTKDFPLLIQRITEIRASKETNITETIEQSIQLFPSGKSTKHLILITDALPTIGKDPEKEVIDQVAIASSTGITISMVGINLDEKGKKFGEKLVKVSGGRFYLVKNLDQLDTIVLEDYYNIS